ncbi:MAG: UDP-N-acetylmuramoyl-L-alanyl-D-glutamate--2,6-diaminopimelate ligase, partial [Nitrospinae bacterium]|nr:UDP-N-acetylmuramoyl-L-alanyl-D-glutamate--2,6-diaminopimelate ligase [Nitrospinota bacterium]
QAMMNAAGFPCGRLGTTGYDLIGQTLDAPNTTPESADIHKMLRTMIGHGAKAVAMEVSSHALAQGRVGQVAFGAALYTNLTQDHLDYHGDMERYFAAKARFFTECAPKVSVLNIDDPYASRLTPLVAGDLFTYGLGGFADVTAEGLVLSAEGSAFHLKTPVGSAPVRSAMAGRYNVYNMLAAVAAAIVHGADLSAIVKGIEGLKAAPGRFERIDEGQPFGVIVDYAHTDDALINVLTTARALAKGRLITVFGCGGDRDNAKRPKMGKAAWAHSDAVIVTSDNPRTERPESIIAMILEGIRPEANPHAALTVVPDRKEAIRAAIAMAAAGDMVVIAGKGHEDYQIVGKTKHHFDDREEAREALKARV